MDYTKIKGFAEEKEDFEFHGFWDWLVAFNDLGDAYRTQPSFIYLQVLLFLGGFITFLHAAKNGGRFLHLWIGIGLHGVIVEFLSHHLKDVNVFWHAQTPIMFFGRRVPSYEIFIYAAYVYPSVIAADKLNLPRWCEPFAVGLVNVLIDYPLDLIGVRFIHWTWHDTDPNIGDRTYHIPWNSFFFYAAFSASFYFWFLLTRRLMFGTPRPTQKWISDKSFIKECICTLIAALLGMPGGILIFISVYHPLHDIYKIHSAVTFFLLFSTYMSIIWLGLPINFQRKCANYAYNRVLLVYMCFYYLFFIGVAAFMDPAAEVSISFHEPIGPCNETAPFKTALGQTLYRRKYLCLTDNDETYFGWSCLPNQQPPKNGAHWYTICGTPFTERFEYLVILTIVTIFAICFFSKTLCPNSPSKQLEDDERKELLKQKKKN